MSELSLTMQAPWMTQIGASTLSVRGERFAVGYQKSHRQIATQANHQIPQGTLMNACMSHPLNRKYDSQPDTAQSAATRSRLLNPPANLPSFPRRRQFDPIRSG